MTKLDSQFAVISFSVVTIFRFDEVKLSVLEAQALSLAKLVFECKEIRL
jgi:hypothetical protein